MDKVYVARILGTPVHSTFTVSCPIRPDVRIRPYQIVDAVAGKPSITQCQVIDKHSDKGRLYASLFPEHLILSVDCDGVNGVHTVESSLIELRPLTGRYDAILQHQILLFSFIVRQCSELISDRTVAAAFAQRCLRYIVVILYASYMLNRTHQLRVHMSHIGHPILGDTLYPIPLQYAALIQDTALTIGTTAENADSSSSSAESSSTVVGTEKDETTRDAVDVCDIEEPAIPVLAAASAPATAPRRADNLYPRLCLHALQLTFRHPASGRQVTLSALSTEASPAPMPSTVPVDHFANTVQSIQRSGSPSSPVVEKAEADRSSV